MFINDILMYSKSEVDHANQLRIVLQTLKKKKLYAKFSKYEFWLDDVTFLSQIIYIEGIIVNQQKVAWYYRQFVESFSVIASPLNKLTRGR